MRASLRTGAGAYDRRMDDRRTSKRRIRATGLALLLILAGAIAFYIHAGWYHGQVFHDRPAPRTDGARPAIVMLSGDMGDHVGMTPSVAARLQDRGYAIVTVNSLTYFSRRRSQAEAAALIDRAMRRAMALGNSDHVVLIGQSFGADMLHAGLALLPAQDRAPIRAVVLVVPGHDIIYRASPVELAGLETPDALALPTASRLSWTPVTCIWGRDETDSLCPELTLSGVRKVPLPGGHRLRFDDAALTAAILPAIEKPRSE